MSDDDLSINAKNRHQYFKTVLATADASERTIVEAEERGRQRIAREQMAKQKFTLAMRITVVVLAVGAFGAAIFFVSQLK